MNLFIKTILDLAKGKIFEWFGNIHLFSSSKEKASEISAGDSLVVVGTQKGFSELVQDQFDYLIDKLDNYQKGYYEISEHTFTLLDQMAALKAELITAKLSQCTAMNCANRTTK